jgi:hypothetical protein
VHVHFDTSWAPAFLSGIGRAILSTYLPTYLLPNGICRDCLVAAACGILDFLNLAQYLMPTSKTLQLQTDALQIFHENKSVFGDLGIQDGLNIPKIHYDVHYFKLFGSSNTYNTEYTEWLHINLVKDAFHSTNFKDTFPQITLVAVVRT